MNKNEIADMLSRFARGNVEPWEFDDFISGTQPEEIEHFRIELLNLDVNYPSSDGKSYCGPDGLRRIDEIAEEIRSMIA